MDLALKTLNGYVTRVADATVISCGIIPAVPVQNGKRRGGRRCSKLRIGSKSSACPSTPGCFAENRIDFSVLPDLTDQHLKDLGLPLGDRLKMLRAIRELAVVSPVSPEAASAERS